jgi:hypothetical protein
LDELILERGMEATRMAGPTLSKNQLRDACLRFDRTKAASIGGEQEAGFEQAFSSLAWAYLKDKAPKLMDYVVGFQLVDRNEDNTKAIGVFGFKVANQWLYAPVFFLNGDLKGHELLYIKNQDMFVPMKENWVNYVLSHKPHALGEASDKDTFDLGGMAPNLERLTWPPEQSKFGSDAPAVREWARPAMPLLAAAMTKKARFLYRTTTNDRCLDMKKIAGAPLRAALAGSVAPLPDLLALNVNLVKGAWNMYQRYPGIKTAFDRFYGPTIFSEVGERIKAAFQKMSSNIMLEPKPVPAPSQRPGKYLFADVAPPEHPVKRGALEVFAADVIGIDRRTDNLDDEDREKLTSHGYLVKDERTGEEITVAYNTQVPQTLTNPNETNIYKVLERPGTTSRMLIVSNPLTNAGRTNSVTVVKLDNKAWVNAHRTAIWSDDVDSREQYESWFKDQSNSDLQKGGVYIALCRDGSGTTPFKVRESFGNDSYEVEFLDRVKWEFNRNNDLGSMSDPYYPDRCHVSTYDAKLVINPHGGHGTALKALAGDLYVPQDAIIFKLKDPPKPEKQDSSNTIMCGGATYDPSDGSAENIIEPGKLEDIQMLFTEKTARMKLYGDNSEVTIHTPQRGFEKMSWLRGLRYLVMEHGLAEKSAREMLRTAQTKRQAIYRVKYAFGFPMERNQEGPNAPAFPQPERGTEQIGYGQVNSQYPQEEFMPVDGLQSGLTDPSVYDPFLMPDQNAVSMAQQAGQRGDKEVFDVSMLSGMLKSVRQDSIVDKYLGDLMKALDRLGRLLVLFYWHQEEWEDRYGKSDLPELEDTLRNSFETLGDLVLFLREKTIEPELEDMPSPNIEEASRN